MNSPESLWSAPEAVLNRLHQTGQDTEWRDFLLCGLYCTVAVCFLVFFGFAALLRGEISYAMVIFGFALTTCLVYGGIWLSGEYHLARHFVVVLMAALCLYLFYSGGTANTGPLYYFVFPIVAVFLQGIRLGSVSVIALVLVTLFIQETALFGFDRERYDFYFISRIYTVYVIISILSFLFAWFRERAERELLLKQEDMESLTHADPLTGLANRDFLERLLDLELNRKRYGSTFCLMAMRVDDFGRIHRRYGTEHCNAILRQLAQLLMDTLRRVDTPARWDEDTLLIILPEATLAGAVLTAGRLSETIKKAFASTGAITVSIGITEARDDVDTTLAAAEANLREASQGNGDHIVSGRATVSTRTPPPGLASHYNKSE